VWVDGAALDALREVCDAELLLAPFTWLAALGTGVGTVSVDLVALDVLGEGEGDAELLPAPFTWPAALGTAAGTV